MKFKNIILKIHIFFIAFFLFSCLCRAEENGALNIPISDDLQHAGFLTSYKRHYPYGFKILRDGSLYLVNTPKKSVMQFDFMGRHIKTYSGKDENFSSCTDICFDNDGMLYVASLESMQVIKLDMLSNEISRFGSYGTGESALKSIYQIEIAGGKKLFVQDTLSGKINVYSSAGTFIKKIECNVAGFYLTAKGQLIYMRHSPACGYSINFLDSNARTPRKIFALGMNAVAGLEFIGCDQKGNFYMAAPIGHPFSSKEKEVIVYNSSAIRFSNYRVKNSALGRQFFIFGDGSLYSAEPDTPNGSDSRPTKISIKKY